MQINSIIDIIFASENIITLTATTTILFFLVGIVAGFVDSVVGGGGLIAFPFLIFFGIPPHNVLATNKLQAVFGTTSAVWHFNKEKKIDFKRFFPAAFLVSLLFATFGVFCISKVSQDSLGKIIPIIMLILLIYKILNFNHGSVVKHKPLLSDKLFVIIFSSLFGFYDGFFGPGIGSFWIFALITFLGMDSLHASANAKFLNLASNVGALIIFAFRGLVCYKIACIMGVGQILGAKFGVKLSIKKGTKFINIMFIAVLSVMIVKLFLKYY